MDSEFFDDEKRFVGVMITVLVLGGRHEITIVMVRLIIPYFSNDLFEDFPTMSATCLNLDKVVVTGSRQFVVTIPVTSFVRRMSGSNNFSDKSV